MTHRWGSSPGRRLALAALPIAAALALVLPAAAYAQQPATTGGATVTAGTAPAYDTVATVNGTVDIDGAGTWMFIYGTDPNNLSSTSSSTQFTGEGQPMSVQTTLSYLQPNTTYYYELQVQTGSSTYNGGVESFTTPPGGTLGSGGLSGLLNSLGLGGLTGNLSGVLTSLGLGSLLGPLGL